MPYIPVPADIAREVVRQQRIMGWPSTVPAYAFVPDAKGNELIVHHFDLTVAQCEQLTEHHARLARKAITKWIKTGKGLRAAGKNILYARLYRCQYLSLIGKTDSTEADMIFPCMTFEEMQGNQ